MSTSLSTTSTLSHYRNLSITNILLLGFEIEKYGLAISSSASNNNTTVEYLSTLDIKKFDSILHFLLTSIHGPAIFIDCWPLLNEKSRSTNYHNIILKLVENIVPSKLIKKTIISSTLCNDEKHWQLILYLSNYTIMKILDTNYLTKVYTPNNELLINSELNLMQIQAFDNVTIETMNDFIKSITKFRLLEEKWNIKNDEWCNLYRSELLLRNAAKEKLDELPIFTLPQHKPGDLYSASEYKEYNNLPNGLWDDWNFDPMISHYSREYGAINECFNDLNDFMIKSELDRESMIRCLNIQKEDLKSISLKSMQEKAPNLIEKLLQEKKSKLTVDFSSILNIFCSNLSTLIDTTNSIKNSNLFSNLIPILITNIEENSPHLVSMEDMNRNIQNVINDSNYRNKAYRNSIKDSLSKTNLSSPKRTNTKIDTSIARTPFVKLITPSNTDSVNFSKILKSISRHSFNSPAVKKLKLQTPVKTPLRPVTLFGKQASKTIETKNKLKYYDKLEKPSLSKSPSAASRPLSPKAGSFSSSPTSFSSKSPIPFISRVNSLKIENEDLRSSLQLLHQNGNPDKIQKVAEVLYSLTLKKNNNFLSKQPIGGRKSHSDRALEDLADSMVDTLTGKSSSMMFEDPMEAMSRTGFQTKKQIPRTPYENERKIPKNNSLRSLTNNNDDQLMFVDISACSDVVLQDLDYQDSILYDKS